MAFPDWFDLLPKVNNFSPLVFCGPVLPIDEGIKAAAWRLSIFTFIRILFLSSWGMTTVDWDDPLTVRKISGIWLEFFILIVLVAISMTMVLVTWKLPIKCLYPCIVAIPIIFIFDFSIKAVCYEAIFLSPVSGFGILSLIEFWIRYGALIQTWLLLTTVIRCTNTVKSSGNIYRPSSNHSPNLTSSSSIMRNNSSIWEKPSQLPKRNVSIPPNLPQISEGESYYTASNRNSSRRSRKESRRPNSYHQMDDNSQQLKSTSNRHSIHSSSHHHQPSVHSHQRQSIHSQSQSIPQSSHSESIMTNPSNFVYRSDRESYQSAAEKYSDEEMELPPPPPRTKPLWNEPEWKRRDSPHFDDGQTFLEKPKIAEYTGNSHYVASRQTSNNSSINAFRQNWQGATNWKSLKQPVNRMNSDMSEMTQYSTNGSPRNRHESPLI